MRIFDITIRGIRGYRASEPDEPLSPGPSTPEERLEAVKAAVREGRVGFAPDERGGFVIQWSEPSIGFGELGFWMDDNGRIHADDEYMGRPFVRAVFEKLLEALE